METVETENTMKSNIEIVQFAAKKWKLLFVIGAISAVFAYVFSSPQFIPPKFKSEAVIYPANLGQYAEENGLEQMQQYLESNDLRDHIIEKFNLFDEYDIKKDDPNKRTWINAAYAEHISFDETRFESIRINTLSTDPVKARDIAVEIIEEVNRIIRKTERKKYQEIVIINKKMMDNKKTHLDSVENLIRNLSVNYGILDYIAQSERVTEKYLDFLLLGKKGADFEEVKLLYENLEKYGRKSHDYHRQLNIVNEDYMELVKEYELAVRNVNKVQTYSNVLVYPEVSDKKSYPIRWLILVTAVFASMGFTFVLLLVLGFQKK